MDSYREAPTDRVWARDDNRGRERDNFYRGRSPGHDRRGERRRSRSPTAVDRYEPRGGRNRDEYAPRERDRDDRTGRRIGSPPANIDRYVPGQETRTGVGAPVVATTVNPLVDPAKLPQQAGFSYFAEWWRIDQTMKREREAARTGRRRSPRAPEDPSSEKLKIQTAYDSYKEDLQARMARTFVAEHRKEQWFQERYVKEIRTPFRARLADFRRSAYTQWEQDLEMGTFDDFSLEGIPKSESNGSGGVVEKEEGEATSTNEILGVSDLVPAPGADIRDDALFQPTLLIKTIAPYVSRENLESFCRENLGEEEGGFKWLSLSDPNPSKRYHRIGWIMLHPSSDGPTVINRGDPKDVDIEAETKSPTAIPTAEKALEAVTGKTVKDEVRGDFTCYVGVHNPSHHPRKKALWDLFSHPDRIDKDLLLVTRLVSRFEDEYDSDFNAIHKVLEKVDDLRASGRLHPAVSAPPSTMTAKKSSPKKEPRMDVAADDGDDVMVDVDEGTVVEDGYDDVDDDDLLAKKKRLDLLIEYLRRVFSFCFFCVFESDSVHELSRKCPGGHLRRPRSSLTPPAKEVARASAIGEPFPSKKRAGVKSEPDEEGEIEAPEPEVVTGRKARNSASKADQQLLRAYNWVRAFEDKIAQILEPENVDLRKLGGRNTDDAVEEDLAKYVKQEDEQKWRCKIPECTKLFKEDHFWRKHVDKRHSDYVDTIRAEFDLINAYVLDPSHIAPSRTDANSNGHFPQPSGQTSSGTPRGFNLHNFPMNSMIPLPNMPINVPTPLFGGHGHHPPVTAGWNATAVAVVGAGGDGAMLRSMSGPIRHSRGGGMGANRGQFRSGPYDRRSGPRFEGGANRRGGGALPGGRWGDGAAGGVVAPREAVQGRSLKSYEDLDQAAGGTGGGELNY